MDRPLGKPFLCVQLQFISFLHAAQTITRLDDNTIR